MDSRTNRIRMVLIMLQLALGIEASTTQKYQAELVPSAGWIAVETIASVRSSLECQRRAWEGNHYGFTFDKGIGMCEVGHVDGSVGGAADKEVFGFVGVGGSVGLSQGGDGTADFEVVSPSGRVCPPSAHGLPAAPVTVRNHGIAEADGVVWLCGGTSDSAGHTDECYLLDLNTETPAWQPTGSLQLASTLARGNGLVAYRDQTTGKTQLVAFFFNPCSRDPIDYLGEDGLWHAAGAMTEPTKYFTVAYEGSLAYLIGGSSCADNARLNKVEVFDLANPTRNTYLLSHTLCLSVQLPSCAIMPVGSKRGILCASGSDSNFRTTLVQFLPLNNDGGDSSGPCETVSNLPMTRIYSKIFFFKESGQALLYAGINSGSVSEQTIFLWDPEKQEFEDTGLTTSVEMTYYASTTIDSKWVKDKCWKYLM